jgi:hypothetical protein
MEDVAAEDVDLECAVAEPSPMSLSETSGPEGEASQLLAFSAFFAKTNS